jgi:hypothetical protein
MNGHHRSSSELNELLSALCDNRIREDQFQRLEYLVLRDADLGWYYIRYMHMHNSLTRYVRIDPEVLASLPLGDQSSHPNINALAVSGSSITTAQLASLDSGHSTQQRWLPKGITRYVIAAAIILTFFVVVDRLAKKSPSGVAFASALRQLNAARVISYTAEFKQDGKIERISESMHLQPDRVREELPDGRSKVIDFSKRKSITIDPVGRTALVVTDTNESPRYKPERFLDKVRECIERIRTDPRRTDRYLGIQSIHDRAREGFEMRKPTQVQTLWVDVDTGLLAEMEIVAADDSGQSVLMRNFEFEVESYESLFSVDPPPGYTVSYETVGPAKPLDDQAKMVPR